MIHTDLMALISLVALLLAMVALRRTVGSRRSDTGGQASPSHRRGYKTDADRRKALVLQKEQENFMAYDGTPQAPIDPDRILGD